MAPTVQALPATFNMPDLVKAWPHQFKVNPYHDVVAPVSDAWFDQYSVYQNDIAKREFFFRSNFGLMTSMCYPDADEKHLRNAMDFLTWLFSFDDSFDEEFRGNPDATKIASNIVSNVLKDPFNYHTEYRLGQSLQDFWLRVVQTATSQMRKRFVDNCLIYLAAVHQQAVNFENHHMPTVEEFLVLRRDTSAAKPVLDFLEYTLNLDKLPDSFHEHPTVRRIKESCNDILSWTNDIHSWNIEQSRGDVDNLITVAMYDRGYTLQEAVDFAGQSVLERMEHFFADRKNLPSFGPEIDEQAEIYMRGIELWVAGSINWNLITERYFLKDNERVRKTLLVKVLPPGADLLPGCGLSFSEKLTNAEVKQLEALSSAEISVGA